jgi:hypothetical protein
MKNKEKFKNEITDIICDGDSIAVDKETRVPIACTNIECDNCLFYNIKQYCVDSLVEWANQEYKEPIVISQNDITFLSYISNKFKYIARDNCNNLYVYDIEPKKYNEYGFWCGNEVIAIFNFNVDLPMIKYTDERAWKISDLKKLKVVENY